MIVVTAYLNRFDDVARGYELWVSRAVRAFAFAVFLVALALYTIALTIRYEGSGATRGPDLADVGWIQALMSR